MLAEVQRQHGMERWLSDCFTLRRYTISAYKYLCVMLAAGYPRLPESDEETRHTLVMSPGAHFTRHDRSRNTHASPCCPRILAAPMISPHLAHGAEPSPSPGKAAKAACPRLPAKVEDLLGQQIPRHTLQPLFPHNEHLLPRALWPVPLLCICGISEASYRTLNVSGFHPP